MLEWIYKEKDRPALEVGHSFSFVLNISGLVGQHSLPLAPGRELRSATDAEIKAIKDVLIRYMSGPEIGRWWLPWETNRVKEEDGETFLPLPKDEWHYYVIAFEGQGAEIPGIEYAFCITPSDLKIGFTVVHNPRGYPPELVTNAVSSLAYHPVRLVSQLRSVWDEELLFFDLTSADVEKYQDCSQTNSIMG